MVMTTDATQLPPLEVDEAEFRRRTMAPPTPDDCTVLRDGRRLDSKRAVIEYYIEQGYISECAGKELLAAT